MNATEFSQWFDFHSTRYPVKKWMTDAGDFAGFLEAWAEVLADVSLDSCLEATRLMYRGDEDAPHGYSNHPKAIRQIAKRLSQGERQDAEAKATHIVNGQITYACHTCQDTGFRFIVTPECMSRIDNADGDIEGSRLSRGVHGVVACVCGSGDVHSRDRRSPITKRIIRGLPRFDAKQMLEHDPSWGNEELIERVLEFLGPKEFTAETWVP
jgi:hypothetical protein